MTYLQNNLYTIFSSLSIIWLWYIAVSVHFKLRKPQIYYQIDQRSQAFSIALCSCFILNIIGHFLNHLVFLVMINTTAMLIFYFYSCSTSTYEEDFWKKPRNRFFGLFILSMAFLGFTLLQFDISISVLIAAGLIFQRHRLIERNQFQQYFEDMQSLRLKLMSMESELRNFSHHNLPMPANDRKWIKKVS